MPPTSRGQQTRNLIIERSAAVFDRLGFAAASLTELVAATGLTRGAFYFHFESKDALAEAIVSTQQARWLPVIDELERTEPDPLARLVRLTYRNGTLFQGDLVMRAGARLMTERALIRRELWRSYPWWVETTCRLLVEAGDDLTDVSRLATETWPNQHQIPNDPPAEIVALAEHLIAAWTGALQLAVAAVPQDLPERVRLSWMATLPWLCQRQDRSEQLIGLVEELTAQMRAAGESAKAATDPADNV